MITTNEEYKRQFEEAVAKQKILECQWKKKQQTSPNDADCVNCENRFICFSMKANKYKIVEYEDVWIIYEVFGENKDEALQTFYDYPGDGEVAREYDRGGESQEVQIEEWNDR